MNTISIAKNSAVAFVCLVILGSYLVVFPLAGFNTVNADHTFTTSAAIYRIPYINGTNVTANNDHETHPNVLNRVDLGGGDGNTIVAAASGIIRGLVDKNGNSSGRGDGLAADGVTAHDDSLEHSCLDDTTVVGDCSDYNNYVWIEHPNGEWTKYTHFQTGSVSIDNGWQVGDTILVGQPIGFQSDIGSASGTHLHFEVAAIPDSAPSPPFSALGGFVSSSWNVVTRVCFSDGDANADGLYTQGEAYTAGSCPNTAPTADAGGPYQVDEGSNVELDGSGSSDPENAILSYSWSPATNLDNAAIVNPNYSGIDDSVNNLTLDVSDIGGDVTAGTALTDSDIATVTVLNVPPTVTAVGDTTSEGSIATVVSAAFTDPGVLDTHTATIDWAEGGPPQAVTIAQLTAGVNHIYGDNGVFNVLVTVTDDDGGVGNDSAVVTVFNVPPTVTAVGDTLNEGETATVSATFTDPGFLDTHTATIDWDDGTAPQAVTVVQLAAGVNHVYGDNGVFNVLVTVTDDDGGSGFDTAVVTVSNLDPSVSIDVNDAISFPGGDYLVVEAGTELPSAANGTDPGSDDLTFTWTTGEINTHFNNGISADPPKSPLGVFPFNASDSIDAAYAGPGVEVLAVTLTDDDGGSDNDDANVIVTGNADATRGSGWWKHQYSGNGSPQINTATAMGYLEIVNAVSSVFSETTAVATMADVHAVLSPNGGDRRARARAELMLGWLQFASGAVDWNATVDAKSGTIGFLPLMFAAEAVINNPASTNQQLQAVELDLARIRHAQ
jgi:murein DD-endopeptidase MepM/ murein hydrolase activator NlpD